MLKIHFDKWNMKLDRHLGGGLWEFHRAESSHCLEGGRRAYRMARLTPHDPADGKLVHVHLVMSATTPEEEWIDRGQGKVSIVPDY